MVTNTNFLDIKKFLDSHLKIYSLWFEREHNDHLFHKKPPCLQDFKVCGVYNISRLRDAYLKNGYCIDHRTDRNVEMFHEILFKLCA